jgi:RNA polymerase sigma factor (sigma-70 family)
VDRALRIRAEWLASAVLPHESAQRHWLLGQGIAADDADDLVQESYAKLSALDSTDHIRNAKTYLFTIARTLIIDRARRAKIVSIVAVEDLPSLQSLDEAPSVETQVSDRQELARLAEGVAALAGRRREVFILRKVHGLPQKEVARQMGISESAVETHLALAIDILGKLLERPGKRRGRPSKTWRRSSDATPQADENDR